MRPLSLTKRVKWSLGSGVLTAYGLRKALRFPEKTKDGFDALPTDVELIQFFDDMEYCWDNNPRSTIPNKRLTKIQSGKIGSLDQASKVQLQMGYSVIAGKHFDYVGAIFDDLKSKIEKTERDPKIPYVHFICACLHFLYDHSSSSRSPTRLVSQQIPSLVIPATTTALKRPSTALPGPSKKARKTKEIAPLSSVPEVVSQQTTLDGFVGLSSTTSAATTTTVSVMTIDETVHVTTPISSVLQQPPEVISTIHISSIPITPPTISLVSNPPSVSQQPQVASIGPDNQNFEGDLHFFNMFDNSGTPKILHIPPISPYKPEQRCAHPLTLLAGPNLAIVDTHVNNLADKVESPTTSVNESTNAVNKAGEELTRLTTASSSKADSSQMTSVQEDIVKIKEDLVGTHQQVQLIQGIYGNLNTDVRDLSRKVDSCTTVLQQVLAKLNEPAPTPTPFFTENDRISLNIAVEFIHQATSDITVIEGHLERLEAKVRSLATTKVAPQSVELSLADNDKEGEKDLNEENVEEVVVEVHTEEPPSHFEGEKVVDQAPPSSTLAQILNEEKDEEEDEEDDEDLDLHDQEKEQPVDDDDDDDEEDQSLWFSAANVTSAIAAKEGKQKGIAAEGNLNIVSRSEGENPSQFSPLLKGTELQIILASTVEEQIISISFSEIDEQEEEEALLHPGRPSRPAHWLEEELNKKTEMISHLESQRLKIPLQQSSNEIDFLNEAEIEESIRAEKLIAECQQDATLSLKVQSSQVKDKRLKKNPVEVQAALLKEIKEERSREQEVSDNSVEWCKQKVDYRSDPLKITAVVISGRKKTDRTSVTMEITREDASSKEMFVSKLESFGYMEWIEFKDALKKSMSIYRGYVEGILDALINRVTGVLNVPSALSSKPRHIKRKPASSFSENVTTIRNETSIKFSKETLFGPPPDLSVLDLSLPPGGPYIPGKVLNNPHGIFFRDDEGVLRFQRVSEIPICPLNHLKDLLCLWCNFSPLVDSIKSIIRQESSDRRQRGEEIPDYTINIPKSYLDS
ncbi:hypothetical protein L6452_37579 [Arctium lappa]|uniref:Uncharacterized protein n=1 Tax=Arctium lappa TaxID=4217 RepID=A0ACB8Y439_ARCLA|nr:hypothetical protein L6452_37579 [Arctium lappa]